MQESDPAFRKKSALSENFYRKSGFLHLDKRGSRKRKFKNFEKPFRNTKRRKNG